MKRRLYRWLLHLLMWACAIAPYALFFWVPPTDSALDNRLLLVFFAAFIGMAIIIYVIFKTRDND